MGDLDVRGIQPDPLGGYRSVVGVIADLSDDGRRAPEKRKTIRNESTAARRSIVKSYRMAAEGRILNSPLEIINTRVRSAYNQVVPHSFQRIAFIAA
jgi:hypothetical protein